MDPNSGRLYTEEEVVAMDIRDKERLVHMTGQESDIRRISEAVRMANEGNLARRDINRQNKNKRRAKNRVARQSRKRNR